MTYAAIIMILIALGMMIRTRHERVATYRAKKLQARHLRHQAGRFTPSQGVHQIQL